MKPQSPPLTSVRLSRGDGLEVESAVTGYGFVLCSLAYEGDCREFDLSDPKQFPKTVDESVTDMLADHQSRMTA